MTSHTFYTFTLLLHLGASLLLLILPLHADEEKEVYFTFHDGTQLKATLLGEDQGFYRVRLSSQILHLSKKDIKTLKSDSLKTPLYTQETLALPNSLSPSGNFRNLSLLRKQRQYQTQLYQQKIALLEGNSEQQEHLEHTLKALLETFELNEKKQIEAIENKIYILEESGKFLEAEKVQKQLHLYFQVLHNDHESQVRTLEEEIQSLQLLGKLEEAQKLQKTTRRIAASPSPLLASQNFEEELDKALGILPAEKRLEEKEPKSDEIEKFKEQLRQGIQRLEEEAEYLKHLGVDIESTPLFAEIQKQENLLEIKIREQSALVSEHLKKTKK
jgi:hypothetical protein